MKSIFVKKERPPPFNIHEFASRKVLGEDGVAVKLGSLWQTRTIMFVFLRHFACIACRTHAVQVWNDREKYESKGAQIVFIGNGAPQFIASFKELLGIEDAVIYTDPTLVSFRAAGFRRGFLAALGPTALVNSVKLVAGDQKQGAYSKDQGDLWQLGGVVVIRPNGEIAFHYISQATGDFPPQNDVVNE